MNTDEATLNAQRRRLSVGLRGEQQNNSTRQAGRRVSQAGQLDGAPLGSYTSLAGDFTEDQVLTFMPQTEAEDAVNWQWAALTSAGRDPGRVTKTNQDSWAVEESMHTGTCAMFGVFDGHGFNGAKVSQMVAVQLPKMLHDSAKVGAGQWEEACTGMFADLNGKVLSKPGLDVEMSGSTAVCAITDGRRVVVANVGDSRCFLGSGKGTELRVTELNVEHKPTLEAEAERIVSSGGRIQPFIHQGEPVGPPRVWQQHVDAPGLCMSRAFGDAMAHEVGVTAEPTFVEHALRAEDRYLVLCSDGITEFITSDEVLSMIAAVRSVSPDAPPKKVCKTILEEARKRWLKEEEDVIDDCTIIVIYLS